MIIPFALIVLTLGLATWLFSMYALWKVSSGTKLTIAQPASLLVRVEQSVRLSRRGWYSAILYIKQVLSWCGQMASALFVRCFPKSAPVFVKRDILTGLTHGPSSYFLKTISPAKKAGTRRLPRTQKMV